MHGRIITPVAELVVGGLRGTAAADVVAASDLSWLREDDESVSLQPYRALLTEVMEAHGPSPILEAGLAIRGVAHPILYVLLNSDRPELLIEKEAQLARYIHSRHAVRILSSDDRGIVLEHHSSGRPPEPTENLASCGQHVAMLEMIGARGLTLRLPRSETPRVPAYASGSVGSVSGVSGFEVWDFRWDAFVPARTPMAGLDEMLLDRARLEMLEDQPGIAAAVERVIREDLGRRWTVDDVARPLFVSRRTLQRRLRQVGRTFSRVVLDTRLDEAARLLRDTELSITSIGYACGFADSSHFNHAFKRREGASPGSWRERLAASG
jgi:AraC-like DNA-binding protein